MAVTKLRADAPPFLLSHYHLQFLTPPPHCMAAVLSPYHPVPGSPSPPFPVVPNYQFAPFIAPAPQSIYGFPPLPHPLAPVPFPGKVVLVPPPPRRKARVALPRNRKVALSPPPKGTGAFLHKADPSPPPPPLSSKGHPSSPPPTKPAPLSRKVLPPGTPPHKLMVFLGGGVVAEKLQAKAAATMARAAEPVKRGQELAPAPARGPRHGSRMAPPRSLRGQPQAARNKVKEVGRRQVKTPAERARNPPARSSSPAFTKWPPSPIPAPEWRKQRVTTVMIRNIPNKLKPCEMMQLLDELCARANSKKKKQPVLAAYDFHYLPMDFSKFSSNMGYAFVNLTTPEAARGLHYALHGARWKVHGTKKVIDICAARIQGKDALVRHFSGSTFPCHTDDYLPASFSPPRDGAAGTPTTATHVGTRVHRPAPQPLPVAPAPQQQEWRPVEQGVVQGAATV